MARSTGRNGADSDDTSEEKTGVLGDLSLAQVLASALAAVTSMLLSSQIGIAGSIIGVAAGAAVASIASQVYKGVLEHSADKLRDRLGSDDEDGVGDSDHQSDGAYGTGRANGSNGADVTSRRPQPGQVIPARRGANPYVTTETSDAVGTSRNPYARGYARANSSSRRGARVAPTELRQAVAERRAKEIQRKVAIVAVIAGLAAVLAVAGVVTLTTAGQGLGAKPQPAVVSDTKAATTAAATKAATTAATTKAAPTAATTESTTEESATTSEAGTKESATTSSATTVAATTSSATTAATTTASTTVAATTKSS